jgi:hypothetical protein
MITVAVAAGDEAANEYYRGLMADAKFDAIFTPEIELLTQLVKSQPVDLILFDLSSPNLSATSWLEAVRQDSALSLTPVLWVGMARPMALATTLDNYRPGARTRQRPNLTSLMELVQKLVGGNTAPTTDAEEPIESSKEWKPEDDTIDDALSIFAEAGQNGRSHARPLPADEDEVIFQTSEISRSGPVSNGKPTAAGSASRTAPEVLAIPSTGPEEKVVINLPDDDLGKNPPSATDTGDLALESETAPKASDVSDALVDEITNKVISRLASEVFKNLDTGAIRQAVREVLSEQGR